MPCLAGFQPASPLPASKRAPAFRRWVGRSKSTQEAGFSRASRSGFSHFAPLAALLASGGAVALANLLYRRWAFGAWGKNGYAFWAPHVYSEFLKTFNFSLLAPLDMLLSRRSGLLRPHDAGRKSSSSARYMAAIAAVCALALLWPRPWSGRRR